MTLCRHLGFAEGNAQVSHSALEKYQRFFEKPLNREHIKALAALLGKEVPEELEAPSQRVVAV